MGRTPPSISSALLCLLASSFGLAVGCSDEKKPASPEDAGEERDAGGGAEDSGEPEQDSGEPEQDAAGPLQGKSRVKGRVTYADGTAVGQVDLQIGGKRYKSDSRGVFSADDLPEGELEVSVEGAGISRAQVKVDASEDRTTQAELFVLPMKKVAVADAEAGGEAGDPADFVKVKLSPGSLRVKRNHEPARGAAETRYALTKQGSDLKAAPGRLKGTRDDQDVDLDSFGMIDMRFFQDDEELELTEEAELELPLGPNGFAEGQEVDAWSFDSASGKWKSEGRAVVDKSKGANGVAKVKATHFSWWTIAQPVEGQSCVSGRLLAADDAPLPYLWVQAQSTSGAYWSSTWAQTDGDGSFCLNVKQGTAYTLSAFGNAESAYFEWVEDVSAGTQEAVCGGPELCTALGDIKGLSLFDECTGNVTDDQDHVLVLSSTNTALDEALVGVLESFGHTVTLGSHYSMFDGTVDLAPYDAVYLQANANWSGDMPEAGQRQLINWVNCGGGLVTTEWTTWKIGSGAFKFIDAIFPAARTTAYQSPAMETFSVVTAEPTLNAGVEDSFTFLTTNYSGAESNLNPRAGAAIYYDSAMLDSGLLGWDYNLGRVASFSTTVGTNELLDANFSRLIANSVDWVQRD